ncbi:hypothetical protein OG711_01985 [Streptomyces uncialis]|uniref:hypothetical protein n=1 Tax=Streptomyces uncialis TaxID=1048205 RepID=UPI002E31B9CC|nr:hypothetical protein [Streptomyces uncialis]
MGRFTGQPSAVGERVTPRVWTVCLDAAGRGLTAVKATRSRSACPPQRLDTPAMLSGSAFADQPGSPQSGADASMPYAVEDFAYPGAARILQEQGIVLKGGDGNITLVTCGSAPGLLEVWALGGRQDRFCFRFTGNQGYLSREIPSVYGVKGNAYTTDVHMTVAGTEKSFTVPESG